MNSVAFPGLGISLNINPVAFSLFGKDIFWYGIIIAVGLILAVLYANNEANRVGLKPDTISDVVIWAAPIAIIFARIFYVIFSWDYYSTHLGEIIAIWNGGIAVYGSIIGAFLTAFIYAKIKKIPFLELADIGAQGFLIGQCIGRWGNFMNMEAYGGETTLPWRMDINDVAKDVHPTFLYESLWNAVGFLILFSLRKKKPYSGFIFLAYVLWYGLGRVWIEGLRTDSLYWGNIRISQLIAGLCIIASIIMMIYMYFRQKRIDLENE